MSVARQRQLTTPEIEAWRERSPLRVWAWSSRTETAGQRMARLAKHMGVERQTPYTWQAGRVLPPADRLARLCKYIRVSMSDYIDWYNAYPQEGA